MRKLASSVAVFLALLLSFAIPTTAQAEDSLGLGVRIENDPEATELYMGNRLWYGIEPGQSKSRTFVVTSRSEIPQEINLYLYDKRFVNGQAEVDVSQFSATSEWALFEPSYLVLQPGEEQRFTMTYQVPNDAPDLAFDSVLRVVATSAQQASGSKDAASAVVRGAAAVELGVFLGIGDALELIPNFNIESIRGVRLPEGRFLEVELFNSGRVPIQLVGTVQLADPTFAERSFGPFSYLSREIFPDETVIAQVPMPDEVESGDWRVFVTAEFGQIKQTRLFEQALNFIPPGSQLSIWDWILRIGLVGLTAAGVVVGLRLLRSKPQAGPEDEISKAQKPIKPRPPKSNALSIPKVVEVHEFNSDSKTAEIKKESRPAPRRTTTTKTRNSGTTKATGKKASSGTAAARATSSTKSSSSTKTRTSKPSTSRTTAAKSSATNPRTTKPSLAKPGSAKSTKTPSSPAALKRTTSVKKSAVRSASKPSASRTKPG